MGIRKSVWKSVNGFDPNLGPGSYLKCGEDSDLTIRALLNGYYVYETPDFYLIHYGFRNWNEADKLIYRYWYGTGAMFAKHLKCGHLSILILLSGLAYRWAFKQSRVIQGIGTNKHRLKRLFPFLKGFYSGLRMPVDRKKQLFIYFQEESQKH